jgi:hypothetical protein
VNKIFILVFFVYFCVCMCVHIVNLYILQIVLYILWIFGQIVQSVKSRFVVQFVKKNEIVRHFKKFFYFKIVRIIQQNFNGLKSNSGIGNWKVLPKTGWGHLCRDIVNNCSACLLLFLELLRSIGKGVIILWLYLFSI